MTAIGIDIGGTQIKAAAFLPDGSVVAQRTAPTADGADAGHPPQFAVNVRTLVRELESLAGPTAHIGLSAPGLASNDHRSISHMPGRLNGLEKFDWPEWLSQRWEHGSNRSGLLSPGTQ